MRSVPGPTIYVARRLAHFLHEAQIIHQPSLKRSHGMGLRVADLICPKFVLAPRL